mmetsp:Transcript_49701/g.115256  ORF Transcript_49701/g.115256 Transcript_49701/m.115256 type:complete len:538 (+) Transcript_49701:106-1719(+)
MDVPGSNERMEPVQSRTVRLRGHFVGDVTTASHCLEVNVPVKHEVPYLAIEPALVAFLQAAKKEEVGQPNDEGAARDGAHLKCSELWQRILTLIAADDGGEESEPRRVSKRTLGDKASRSVRTDDARFQRLQEKEAALEIDYAAKEDLLAEVMLERDTLQRELDELKSSRPAQSHCTGFVQHAQRALSCALGLQANEAEPAVAESADKERVFPDGSSVILEGHFSGNVYTKSHHLEVVLPVEGTVPGAPLLEILRALAEVRHSFPGAAHHVDPHVWEHLITLIHAELPPETATSPAPELIRAELPTDSVASPAPKLPAEKTASELPVTQSAAQEETLQKEVEKLKASLQEASCELVAMRAEHVKDQMEAEQLRARNSTLAGHLASAETTAQKLRTALNHVSRATPAETASVDGHAVPPVEAGCAETAQGAQMPSPKEVGGRQETQGVQEEMFVGHGLHRMNHVPAYCHGDSQSTTPLRPTTPPQTSTPSSNSTPRRCVGRSKRADLTPRLKLTDAALVADLQELERWAQELRSLKAA